MPRLEDHPSEIDKTYTPMERRRREEMRLKDVKYGFFRVVKEAVAPPVCHKCSKNIYGQALVIDGKISHYHECVQ